MIKKYKNIFLVILIFFILAAIFTYPLVFHFGEFIYAEPGDPFGILYYLGWIKSHAADYLFPNSPVFTFIGKYLTIIFGEIIAYNIITFLGFILTGLAGYLLAKKITDNKMVSFFSGFILAITPFRVAQAMQHIAFADLSLILFFIYFLFKSKEIPSFVNIFFCAIFFTSTILYNSQYGLFAGIILLAFIIYFALVWLIQNKFKVSFAGLKSKSIVYVLIAVLFSATIVVFFNYNLVRDTLAVKNNDKIAVSPVRNYSELDTYSARWFYYVAPSPENPIFGKYTKQLYDNIIEEKGTNLTEQTLYLGIIPLLLMIYGLVQIIRKEPSTVRYKKIAGFFVVLGLVGLYFSFAPYINIFGHEFKTPAYYIFPHLPFFRVYARFGLLVLISVSMLAGIGLVLLMNKIKSQKFVLLFFSSLVLLLILEFINIPPTKTINVSEQAMPQVYKYLETQPIGLVAEYPLLPADTPLGYEYLLWQRYHKMPLVYGAPINSENDNLRKTVLNPSDPSVIQKLHDTNVKYIIIHSSLYNNYINKFFPVEDTNGIVPKINSPLAEIISNYNGDLIYRIK